MGKAREFTTMPARAIADTRLTALDLRCLMAIAIHDGMSLVKGNGLGCYAKSATLSELVRTDITNFSKALSRLIKLGYVVREPQQGDKRRFTHRVIYGDDDSWRTDQLSQGASVGEPTNYPSEMVGEMTNYDGEIVGEATNYFSPENGSESRRNPPENLCSPGAEYISLNEELDFVETSEINSAEAAHLAKRDAHWDEFIDQNIIPLSRKKDRAEAPATGKVSIFDHLPKTFAKLSMEAKLVRFELAWTLIGRKVDGLDSREISQWSDWLFALADEMHGEPMGHQALRLLSEMDAARSEVRHAAN